MEVVLQNGKMSVRVDSLGAELRSISSCQTGREYLYQPDGIHWDKQSPLLFPVIGKLRDGRYTYQEQDYWLGKHGFAREKDFQVVYQDDHSVILELTQATANMWEFYPFEFTLRLHYQIKDCKLSIRYELIAGDQELWFSIGGHPAVALPLEDGKSYEDYRITLLSSSSGTVLSRLPLDGPFIASLDGSDYPSTFGLNHDLFVDDALIFQTNGQTSLRIESSDGEGAAVQVDYEAFPYVGVWSMVDDSPFVCIEPWDGLPDTTTATGILEEKAGIRHLAPHEHYDNRFTITIV